MPNLVKFELLLKNSTSNDCPMISLPILPPLLLLLLLLLKYWVLSEILLFLWFALLFC